VNFSNDFLPEKRKLNPEKLAKKNLLYNKNNIMTFKDIEGEFGSDVD
jgi:hypothetical protein